MTTEEELKQMHMKEVCDENLFCFDTVQAVDNRCETWIQCEIESGTVRLVPGNLKRADGNHEVEVWKDGVMSVFYFTDDGWPMWERFTEKAREYFFEYSAFGCPLGFDPCGVKESEI